MYMRVTVYCGPNGALIMEVQMYGGAYCDPNSVLMVEILL